MWHTSREYSIGPKALPMQIYDICGMISRIIFPHGNVLLAASFYFLYHSLASLFSSIDGLEILYHSLQWQAFYYKIFPFLEKKARLLQGENWKCSTSFSICNSLWGSNIRALLTQQSKLKTLLSVFVGFAARFRVEAKCIWQITTPSLQDYKV